MNEKNRQTLFLIVFGILLFAVVMNFSVVLTFLRRITDLLFPILLGLLFAFVLNVPMTGFEKLLTRLSARAKHEPSIRLLHGMSLMLTLLCIAFVIFLAFALVLPELAESAKSVWPLLKEPVSYTHLYYRISRFFSQKIPAQRKIRAPPKPER